MSKEQLQQVNDMIRAAHLGALELPELRVAFDAQGDITPPDPSISIERVTSVKVV